MNFRLWLPLEEHWVRGFLIEVILSMNTYAAHMCKYTTLNLTFFIMDLRHAI